MTGGGQGRERERPEQKEGQEQRAGWWLQQRVADPQRAGVLRKTGNLLALAQMMKNWAMRKVTPAGLAPAIPGSVGRCLIHCATGPGENWSRPQKSTILGPSFPHPAAPPPQGHPSSCHPFPAAPPPPACRCPFRTPVPLRRKQCLCPGSKGGGPSAPPQPPHNTNTHHRYPCVSMEIKVKGGGGFQGAGDSATCASFLDLPRA